MVGNPPYASPLKAGAVNAATMDFHEAHSDRLGPYADVAAMHLLRAVQELPPRGRVVFVLPQGIVSGRDTAVLRSWLTHAAPTTAVWATEKPVFAAGVRVWAPVLERAGGTSGVTVANGEDVKPVAVVAPSDWADLAASALGIPPLGSLGPPLGTRVQATSGFRDEFYGLAKACHEARPGDGPENDRLPVLTVGSLDPLVSWWGNRQTKLGGKTYSRPVIHLDELDPRTARWVAQNRKPKILLPTQTKVLEPVIDRTGDLIGATPVVLIHADPETLNHVAALLLAPPVVAWAARKFVGSGLTVSSIRLAAKNVSDLPTPLRSEPWNRAARLVATSYEGMPKVDRLKLLDEVAVEMNTAFDAPTSVLQWWRTRLG